MARDPDQEFHILLGEFVRGECEDGKVEDQAFRDRLDGLVHYWREGETQVGSPLERLLLAHLLFITDGYNYLKWDEFDGHFGNPEFGTIFRFQERIGKFTADFYFETHYRGHFRKLVVECDGHDFHDRTKQQVARDKARDRAMLSLDVQVMRFSGYELHKDPAECAREVEGRLMALMDECLMDGEAIPRRPRGDKP